MESQHFQKVLQSLETGILHIQSAYADAHSHTQPAGISGPTADLKKRALTQDRTTYQHHLRN